MYYYHKAEPSIQTFKKYYSYLEIVDVKSQKTNVAASVIVVMLRYDVILLLSITSFLFLGISVDRKL